MSKASPIIPLVSNLLGFGIPAIAEAVERGKARKAQKKASEVEEAAKAAGASAASGLGAIMAGTGISIGAVDQLGAGAQILHSLTSIPMDALPAHAPEWVQYAYFGITLLGVVLRFVATKYPKPEVQP